jgi:deoxyribodipyrimidine photolyase-related protein
MSDITLIFPHQLFDQHPSIQPSIPIVLVEEELFFRQFNFHKQKLILHRASMKAFADELISKGYQVNYIASHHENNRIEQLIKSLSAEGISRIHCANPNDYLLKRRLLRAVAKAGLQLLISDGPDFLTTPVEGEHFFSNKKHYHQTDFYIHQRKKMTILLDENCKPQGGKWSMDTENRKKIPKGYQTPQIKFPDKDQFLAEAVNYVKLHFENNPGKLEPDEGAYPWAWTRKGARILLKNFMDTRLAAFGEYEDAMPAGENFLHHSILSPMLNIGLITPKEILQVFQDKIAESSIPLNSAEGFIRQIIGWREFIRLVYLQKGVEQRTSNYWKFKRKIPPSFYKGCTGILPVDNCIKKVGNNGYLHHIERLMILGNFFLLCEFDPDEVYRWFMELFIDAYDWVMVPNVYGMTQFADGGLMMTKPYISGSNYLFKMSDYKKQSSSGQIPAWNEIWDGLFWRFMDKHRTFFHKNPRLGMLVNTFDKMDIQKQIKLKQDAAYFLDKLDSEIQEV